MNCQTKALLLSLATHSGLIYLAFAISSSPAHPEKPIVIDFTLRDTGGPQPSGAEKTARKSPREFSGPKNTEKKQKRITEKPRIAIVGPSHPKQVPAPATAPKGSVAIPPTSSISPAPVATAVEENRPSGDATGKSGRDAGGGSSGSGTGHGQGRGEPTSGNGAGNASEQMRNKYLKEHFEYIKNLIQKNLVYPARARRMGWQGRTVISFTILENGRVQNIKILNSSGYNLLDDNVMETITKVEPFPKPPVRAELKFPITYRLH